MVVGMVLVLVTGMVTVVVMGKERVKNGLSIYLTTCICLSLSVSLFFLHLSNQLTITTYLTTWLNHLTSSCQPNPSPCQPKPFPVNQTPSTCIPVHLSI